MAKSSAVLRSPPASVPSAPVGDMSGVGLLGAGVGHERRRGRGTLSNASGRYEPIAQIGRAHV